MFGGKSEKDPEGTLVKAEALIEKNPGNVLAHEMLAEAANLLEMKETVVFAYETIRKIHPTNIKNLERTWKCLPRIRKYRKGNRDW